jgi:hypothetical protein
MENTIKIQDIKKGDFFKKTPTAKKTFERGNYCRFNKSYECTDTEDLSSFAYLKKNKVVVLL